MNTKIFGERLKQRRKELDISALELAEKLGMNKSTIHRYENADFKNIKLGTIELIAYYLHVNPEWLTGKSENKFPSTSVQNGALLLSERELLDKFRLLNERGQEQALTQIALLTKIPELTEKNGRTASLA